jgi:hypothetical protein
MHEALIPKSAIMKTIPEIQDMINHPCNCVIRHHICPGGKMSHTGGTGGEEVFKKCLDNLVYWEGKNAVEEYLKFMAEQTQIVGSQALQRFYGYYPPRKNEQELISLKYPFTITERPQ